MSTSTNKGSQNVWFQYGDPLTGAEFNTRNINILPIGIYAGGLLTKVSDTSVTVGAWTVVISDGTYIVSARASSDYDVTSVSSSARNLILRWTYNTSNTWYVDILAVTDGNVQSNDLVLGRAIYSGSTLTGFSYTGRIEPNALSQFLRVIPTPTPSMSVLIKSGWATYGSSRLFIPTQSTSTITAPVSNPRIDLIYVDTAGAIQISTGTEAASPSAPDYAGRVILAEINLSTSTTSITSSLITDARTLLTGSSVPVGARMGWWTTTAPTGWLLEDGSAISRTTYSALFSVIGTTFGTGDGSTTFNIPNSKGKVVVSRDSAQSEFDTIGETGGEKTHLLTSAESGVPAHTHPNTTSGDNTSGPFLRNTNQGNSNINTGANSAQDAAQAHNNLQPYIVGNGIIKY